MVGSKFALIFSLVILSRQYILISSSVQVSCCIEKSCWLANKGSQLAIEFNCPCVSKPFGKTGSCGAQEVLVSTRDEDPLQREKRADDKEALVFAKDDEPLQREKRADVGKSTKISNVWFQRVRSLIVFVIS